MTTYVHINTSHWDKRTSGFLISSKKSFEIKRKCRNIELHLKMKKSAIGSVI